MSNFYRVYRVIVAPNEEVSQDRRAKRSLPDVCDEDELYGYHVALALGISCYIAAEVDVSTVGKSGYMFTIGDGKTYGRFENVKPPEPLVMVMVGVMAYHVSRFVY